MENQRNSKIENVKVYLRLRPTLSHETKNKKELIQIDETDSIITLYKPPKPAPFKTYQFDRIFTEEAEQTDIYKSIAAPIVDTVLKGFNGTIFAYGQTGSGKTYTMVGKLQQSEFYGIIPSAFSHLFQQILKSADTKSFLVTATYLEIYNENIIDLLGDKTNAKLSIHERKNSDIYVKGLSSYTVSNEKDIMTLFARGNKNRTTKATMMNTESSRSHAIFTIVVESKDDGECVRVGKLNFVDLAGSERVSRSKVTGVDLRDAGSINLSLSALGNVISSLVDEKSSHIPYRNSKLTRLLQDSLGGNSKTVMIANISPNEVDFDESFCTIRYAARVKEIRNFVKLNVHESSIIQTFEKELATLREQVAELELRQQEKQNRKQQLKANVQLERQKEMEKEIKKTEDQRQYLLLQICAIQRKIIIGGENVFELVKKQSSELESTKLALVSIDQTNDNLENVLSRKSAENIELRENCSTLQEESEELDQKIKKAELLIQKAQSELHRRQRKHQFNLIKKTKKQRELQKNLSLQAHIIENYIPDTHLNKIENQILWNKESSEFILKHVASAGNNSKRLKNVSKRWLSIL